MFSIALQRKIKVQDFKSYPLPFPVKDPSCLTRSTPTMLKEMSKMHEEVACDDNLIAMETSNQIHSRTRMRAAKNAADSHILKTADLNDDANLLLHVRNDDPTVPATNKERENATLLPTILPPHATSGDDLAAARPFIEHYASSISTPILPITANSRSEKHLHVILSKLACQNTTPRANWYQKERCASIESRPRKYHRRKLS